MKKRGFATLATLVILGMNLPSGVALAQQPAPTENKGVVNKPLGVVDLGPEIEGMAGRQLRIRMVTIEPGGVIAVHNHKDTPSVEYVLQGRVTEYRNGVAKEYGPGDFVTANKDTTHGWENKGAVPVVLLPVDIFKP
jgi:quercetin dioxygenase-like cupin family protein